MNKETLGEKRKELFEDLLKQFKGIRSIEKVLFVTLNCVDDQDEEKLKEFLDELKEKKFTNNCPCEMCKDREWVIDIKDIDKLALEKFGELSK